jgi:hypothetical protein
VNADLCNFKATAFTISLGTGDSTFLRPRFPRRKNFIKDSSAGRSILNSATRSEMIRHLTVLALVYSTLDYFAGILRTF